MRSAAFGSKVVHAKTSCAKAGAPIRYGWVFCVRNGCRCSMEIQYERCFHRETRSLERGGPRGNEQGFYALEPRLGIYAPFDDVGAAIKFGQSHPEMDGERIRRGTTH